MGPTKFEVIRALLGYLLVLLLLGGWIWAILTYEPTPAKKLAGEWVLVSGEYAPARLSVVRTSDDGGTYVARHQEGQLIGRGTWTVQDNQLTVIVTDAPWSYRLTLRFSGKSLPMYTELRIQELTKTRLVLISDAGGGGEAVTYEYRRP